MCEGGEIMKGVEVESGVMNGEKNVSKGYRFQ